MPANDIQVPVLPEKVRKAMSGYRGHRHPFLMQGMLFGHWARPNPPAELERTKRFETRQQAKNLEDHFVGKRAELEAIAERQAGAAATLGAIARSLRATVGHRLLIGTGLPNQLETGLLLHPLYGVPYLPGSAVKGVTQAYLLASWAAEAGIGRLPLRQYRCRQAPTPLQAFERLLFASDADEPPLDDGTLVTKVWLATRDETRQSLEESGGTAAQLTAFDAWIVGNGRDKGRLYVDLFGAPAQEFPARDRPHPGSRGQVRFLDAFPTMLTMEAGGQTPHAGPYYRAAHEYLDDPSRPADVPPPDDHFDPVPFAYPLVAAGSSFLVTVAAPVDDLADAAAQAVTSALEVDGLGAKRGIGFGRFMVTPA